MFSEEIFKEQTGVDFSSFYKEYNPNLIYYINSICNDVEMARDIATDSYMQAMNNILSYDKNKAKFSTWLFCIAKNHTINEIKHNKRYVIEDISSYDDVTEAYDEDPFSVEKALYVKDNIQKLNYPYNIVMNMILLENRSYKDISEYFDDKNINTVKSWVRKGKSLLRNLLELKFGLYKNKIIENECS